VNELKCEPVSRFFSCRHVFGEECLLRSLERYGRCPVCRVNHCVVFTDDTSTVVNGNGNRASDQSEVDEVMLTIVWAAAQDAARIGARRLAASILMEEIHLLSELS
jgi:hypothetical protein